MDRACSGPCNNPGLTLYSLQFSAFAWFYVFYGEGAGRVKQIQAGRDVRTRRAQPGGGLENRAISGLTSGSKHAARAIGEMNQTHTPSPEG